MKLSLGPVIALICLIFIFTACEDPGKELSDNTPPKPGGDGLISFFDPSSDSLWISWVEAEDDKTSQEYLMYQVYYSYEDNIQDIEGIRTNGILAVDWQENTTSAYLSGLWENSQYYVNILVRDAKGNTASYAGKRVITLPGAASAFNMTSPTHHAYVSGSPPTLNYTFDDPLSTLTFTLNGTEWSAYDGEILWSAIPGLNTLEATVTDPFGGSTTETMVFFYWNSSGATQLFNDQFERVSTGPDNGWGQGDQNDVLLGTDGSQLTGTNTGLTEEAFDSWYCPFSGAWYPERLMHLSIGEMQPDSVVELLLWESTAPQGQIGVLAERNFDGTVNLKMYEYSDIDGIYEDIGSTLNTPVDFNNGVHFVFYNYDRTYQAALADENLDILAYVSAENYDRQISGDLDQAGISFHTKDQNGTYEVIFRADDFSFEVR